MTFKYTVFDRHLALAFKSGRFQKTLEPGTYWRTPGTEVLLFDKRPRVHFVGCQEVLTKDGASLRITLAATQMVVNAYRFYMAGGVPENGKVADNAILGFHVELQTALREALAVRNFKEVFEDRESLVSGLIDAAKTKAASVGLELMDLKLRDLVVSGSLKSAYADLLKAQLDAQANLERARGEAATLRSLVNTAKLTQEHPGLLELRILSSGQKPRVTFNVGSSESAKES